MDIAVSPRMARRRGATKEHVRLGPVTEEQRSRRAIIGETFGLRPFCPVALSLGRPAVAGSIKDMARRPASRDQKFSQQQCP